MIFSYYINRQSNIYIHMLEIKKFKSMGKGVVATQDIKRGTLILSNELIILDEVSDIFLQYTQLSQYVYGWSKNRTALAMGLGSFFNHSETENIDYKRDFKNIKINYYAKKNIKKGEQLFINYNYNVYDSIKIFKEMRKQGKKLISESDELVQKVLNQYYKG